MSAVLLGFIFLFFVGVGVFAAPIPQSVNCGGHSFLNYGRVEYFTSPGYPKVYARGLHCQWMAVSPLYTAMTLKCQIFDTAPSQFCSADAFYFSPSGDYFMRDANAYCGNGTLEVTTKSNYFSVRFLSQDYQANVYPGFFCTVKVVLPNGGSVVATPNPDPPLVNFPNSPANKDQTVNPSAKSSCMCGVQGGSRIVGGSETAVNEWPWQAGLRYVPSDQIFCGASLISPQWLVTAAHCVQPFAVQDIYVTLGDHDKYLSSDSAYTQDIPLSKIIIHEGYSSLTVDNDIALLRLRTPVTYNEGIRPICLPFQYASQNLSGHLGTVTGWGSLEFLGILSPVLMKVQLPILTTSECKRYNFKTTAITDNMICTYLPEKDACQGDSGGPLQWRNKDSWYLMGIVSFGEEGCASLDSPGVYTKVTNYLQWIQDHTSERFCSPPK